jgi:predicted metalloprotease
MHQRGHDMKMEHPRGRALLLVACAAAIAMLIAACGSGSKTTTQAPSTTTTTSPGPSTKAAAAAHLRVLHGVPAPAGARKATPAALSKLPSVRKAGGPAAHIKGLSGQPVAAQIAALDADLNQFWTQAFAGSKLQWPQTQEAIVQDSPVQTQCSDKATIAPTDPPLLCNNVFFWPVQWLEQNVDPQGGVALAFTASILWSLDAQDQLGNTKALQAGQLTKTQYGNQTLCFTGLWFRTLGARKLFEPSDSQLAGKILSSLTGVDQITAPDVTPDSLTKAFEDGYSSGDFASCAPQAMSTP